MGVNHILIRWIYNFLTERQQYVHVQGGRSSYISTQTGVPQGCVLAPLLFILYINDLISHQDYCKMIKFADDVALIGLLTDDETSYRAVIDHFYNWCSENALILNTKKTKEMVFDFRQSPISLPPVTMNNVPIEIVQEYKYLGTIIDSKLTWNANTNARSAKAQQRLYFLRKLRSFKVDRTLQILFYKTCIQSVLTFCIQCWGGALSVQNKNKLDRVVKLGGKITGEAMCSITHMSDQYTRNLAQKIIADQLHPLWSEYALLPSGRRYCMPRTRTKRCITSFVPRSIQLLNKF